MASSAAAANGNAPTLGDLVEAWVTQEFDYEHADEDFFDHLGPSGTKIQVKGTQKWIKNGYKGGDQQWTRGRFKLWEGDHEKLAEEGGLYLLIIYEEVEDADEDEDDINVLAWELVEPPEVDDAVDEWWTVDNIRCSTKGDVQRIRWPTFIDPDDVADCEARRGD